MEGMGAGPRCGARSSDAPGVSKLPGVAPMGVRSPARRAAMLACARRSAAGSRDRSACGPQPPAAPVTPGAPVQRHRRPAHKLAAACTGKLLQQQEEQLLAFAVICLSSTAVNYHRLQSSYGLQSFIIDEREK